MSKIEKKIEDEIKYCRKKINTLKILQEVDKEIQRINKEHGLNFSIDRYSADGDNCTFGENYYELSLMVPFNPSHSYACGLQMGLDVAKKHYSFKERFRRFIRRQILNKTK